MPKSKLIIEKDVVVFNGRYIQTIKRHFRNRITRKSGVWEMVKRKTHGRIVAVVALTPKLEVILTKIYRVPWKRWMIETCAGLADKKGESEISLARRELLEETGYAVARMEKIISGPFNAGLLADDIVYYLGVGARKVQEPELEDAEDIEVLKIPLKKLEYFLWHPPRGTLVDIKLFAILSLLEKRFANVFKRR